jgi:hypothetical protein
MAKKVAKKAAAAKRPAAKKAPAKPAKNAKSVAPKKKVAAKSAPAKGTSAKAAPKKAAPAEKKKAPKRVRAPKEVRLKAFWGVFNQSLRRVAIYEFNERKAADKKAAELTKSGKSPHFVQPVKEQIVEG